jgi:vacuolar-type H+-ATPase subunit E/Vma4
MSLESILEHILNEAELEKNKIVQEALAQVDAIIRQAKEEAAGFYKSIVAKEKSLHEHHKKKLIVNASLEHKKNLLAAKQELIDEVFSRLKSTLKAERFKKEQVSYDKVKETVEDIDFYLAMLRQEHETEIARILFK